MYKPLVYIVISEQKLCSKHGLCWCYMAHINWLGESTTLTVGTYRKALEIHASLALFLDDALPQHCSGESAADATE